MGRLLNLVIFGAAFYGVAFAMMKAREAGTDPFVMNAIGLFGVVAGLLFLRWPPFTWFDDPTPIAEDEVGSEAVHAPERPTWMGDSAGNTRRLLIILGVFLALVAGVVVYFRAA